MLWRILYTCMKTWFEYIDHFHLLPCWRKNTYKQKNYVNYLICWTSELWIHPAGGSFFLWMKVVNRVVTDQCQSICSLHGRLSDQVSTFDARLGIADSGRDFRSHRWFSTFYVTKVRGKNRPCCRSSTGDVTTQKLNTRVNCSKSTS